MMNLPNREEILTLLRSKTDGALEFHVKELPLYGELIRTVGEVLDAVEGVMRTHGSRCDWGSWYDLKAGMSKLEGTQYKYQNAWKLLLTLQYNLKSTTYLAAWGQMQPSVVSTVAACGVELDNAGRELEAALEHFLRDLHEWFESEKR